MPFSLLTTTTPNLKEVCTTPRGLEIKHSWELSLTLSLIEQNCTTEHAGCFVCPFPELKIPTNCFYDVEFRDSTRSSEPSCDHNHNIQHKMEDQDSSTNGAELVRQGMTQVPNQLNTTDIVSRCKEQTRLRPIFERYGLPQCS